MAGSIMSACDIQNQRAIVLVQQTSHAGAEISAVPPRGPASRTARGRRNYIFAPAAEEFRETADASLSFAGRVDALNLRQISRQLLDLANRREPRIALKSNGTILLLGSSDILAVQAEGNYVSLQHRSARYFVHESLSSVAEKLRPLGFIRIHRSVVVNVSAVEEIRPLPTGEYRLRVKGGKEYQVTRTYKHNLGEVAQLWVGTERLRG